MSKILVLTPLASEMKRLKSQLGSWKLEATSLSSRLSIEKVADKDIFFTLCGLGKPQSALQTQHALDAIGEVESIILIGAGGALETTLEAGDLVIAKETIEHDFKERFNPCPLPRFENSQRWLEKISSLNLGHRIANIASGDEDIIDRTRALELVRETAAHAVAWEGAGVARAAKFNDCEFLEVRAITDGANENAPEDFDKNLTLAMRRAAKLLLQIF